MGVIDVERIKSELSAARIGKRIEYIETTTSTNDEAWARAGSCDADGLVILTEYQSAGRGRLGRKWESPRGASLLCSVLVIERELKDVTERSKATGEIVLRSAIAACDAIRFSADARVAIKWPNDLLIEGKKVGGILVESRQSAPECVTFVIGIGINCLQHEGHLKAVRDHHVTSLDLETEHPVDRSGLAAALLNEFDSRLASLRDGTDVRQTWIERADPVGRCVRLRHGGDVFTGSVIDIDPAAALVVRLDEGGVRAFDLATTTVL